jgi:hypothetical protein
LRELDKEYKLTDEHYTIDDFIEDLKKRIHQRRTKEDGSSGIGITAKQNAHQAAGIRSNFWKFETLWKQETQNILGNGGEFRSSILAPGGLQSSNRVGAKSME